jgi:hypothetical protein
MDKAKVSALAEEMNRVDDKNNFIAEPFQHLRPRPADQEENWYEWNLSNWGTKWDARILDWSHDDENTVAIYFDSPWGPPIALYDYLTDEGWEVNALYHEPGMNFAGQYNNGIDNYYEYDVSDPEFLDQLPGDVIEFANLFDAHEEWICRELQDNWTDAERSKWNKVGHKPEIEGWYEVTTKGWDYPHFVRFKDGEWDTWDPKTIVKWRGLAKNPEMSYEEQFDLIKKELDNIRL